MVSIPLSQPWRPAPQRGFALLITITLLAFLVLLLVSLATLTRVETHVAGNMQTQAQARQNAMQALSIALGQLQKLAGPDQRTTATSAILGGEKDGSRFWTGVWGNAKTAGDQVSSPAGLGWLVSGNEAATFTVSTDAGDFGRVTSAVSNVTYSPGDAIDLGSAATVGALASDVSVKGDEARVLIGPAGTTKVADYVVAPLADIVVAADTIPGLTGTDPTVIGRYAWWVGDEGVKARLNWVDPWADLASTNAERFNRLRVGQRHGIELMWREEAGTPFGDSLYDVEGTGAPAESFRGVLRRALTGRQVSLLPGFETAVVQTGLKRRIHDSTTYSSGVPADQLRGGLRRDLTALLEKAPAAWTGSLGASLEEVSVNDGGLLRIADFKNSDLYESAVYSMDSSKGVDARSPIAATWAQVQSYYRLAKTNSGSVAAAAMSDSQMATGPLILRWGLAFDLSSSGDGSSPQLHLFPHIVLWNPYNATLTGSYRVRMEFSSSDSTAAKWLYFVTPRRDADDAPVLAAPYTVYHRDLIAVADSSRPGKYSNHTLEFTLPSVSIPAGQAIVFTPAGAGSAYQTSGNNPLVPGYNTTTSFTRPISHVFTPDEVEDSAVVLASPSGGGTISVHLLEDASGGNLQMIDSVGILGGQVTVDAGGASASAITGGSAVGSIDFKNLTNAVSSRGQSGLCGISNQQDKSGRYNWLAQYNQRAPSVGHAWFEWSEGFASAANWSAATLFSKNSDWEIDLVGGSQTYTGPSRFASNGVSQAVLFHLPGTATPILSLGQLQHAALSFMTSGLEPTYPLGNSYASPLIAQDKLVNPNPNALGSLYKNSEPHLIDTSYLLNRVLWDRFYFSGTPAVADSVLQARIDAGEPLPNGRLRYRANVSAADARDFDRGAASLTVEGAFNVNSVSVEAWTALLSSLRGVSVNPATGATGTMTGSPYVRTPLVPGGQNSASATDQWNGYRALTDAQVRTLASAMVAEVKRRGPFLSLADFVNRSLAAYPDESGLSGALQSALDASASLNTAVLEQVRPSSGANDIPLGTAETRAIGSTPHDYYWQNILAPRRNTTLTGAKAAMAPGFLSQADLLQVLGPGLAARSDTFVIRAYGETVNPLLASSDAGYITGRAWCEAVVQRLPDYVDEVGNPAETRPVSFAGVVVLTPENQRFGRRFQVVAFRWLSPSEI